MQLHTWVTWVAGATILAFSTVSAVQAQPVTFSDITDAVPSEVLDAAPTAPDPLEPANVSTVSAAEEPTVTFSDFFDAVPSRFFDAATTAPDPSTPNKLIIGFNTGIDSKTWKFNPFTASEAAFHHASAMDTISFIVTAPADSYISRISYTQSGTGSIARTGRAAGGTNWVVDGVAVDLGLFEANPTLSSTIDLTDQNKTSILVSITTSLFTFATPNLGSATVTVTSAEVLVELLPLLP